eukprot:scaffold1230_cov201-Alexandrium_tamarense.AAC.13
MYYCDTWYLSVLSSLGPRVGVLDGLLNGKAMTHIFTHMNGTSDLSLPPPTLFPPLNVRPFATIDPLPFLIVQWA